jgi:hypothetical protein
MQVWSMADAAPVTCAPALPTSCEITVAPICARPAQAPPPCHALRLFG